MVRDALPQLLALASRDGRVCPRPLAWIDLYELLPGRRHDGYGMIPPGPPSTEAWKAMGDEQKRIRLVEHLEWAAARGALPAVRAFLEQMMEGEWHHVGD